MPHQPAPDQTAAERMKEESVNPRKLAMFSRILLCLLVLAMHEKVFQNQQKVVPSAPKIVPGMLQGRLPGLPRIDFFSKNYAESFQTQRGQLASPHFKRKIKKSRAGLGGQNGAKIKKNHLNLGCCFRTAFRIDF